MAVAAVTVGVTLVAQSFIGAQDGGVSSNVKTHSGQTHSLSTPTNANENNATNMVAVAPAKVENLTNDNVIEHEGVESEPDIMLVDNDTSVFANILGTSSLSGMLANLSIETVSGEDSDLYIEDFKAWMETSANPAKDILEYLSSGIDDNAKYTMQFLIAFGGDQHLSENFISELAIAGESDYENFTEIMSVMDVSTTETRNNLMEVLPTLSSPELVSNSIRSMRPSIVPGTERTDFLSDVALYANSENEEVRSAAIESIGSWAAHDYSHLIANELSQGTEKTKHAAIMAAGSANMYSNDIKNGLSNILLDENAPIQHRIDAFGVLSGFPLTNAEYDQQYDFYREHILPLEQLANQG